MRKRRKRKAVAKRRQGLASRERLLDAAEKLFARYGFNGVSVRQIVHAAKVNLGAVPYHFGTKEELFKELKSRLKKSRVSADEFFSLVPGNSEIA